jgi:ribosomal protein S27AE
MSKCRHCHISYEAPSWQVTRGDYECGPCRRNRQAEYRASRKASGNPVVSGKMPREYHRSYEKVYFQDPENRERRNALMREYSKAHGTREHHRARRKVRTAIASGRLAREACEVCGESKVHAHHDDYSKPLEVRWLCPAHHYEHHAKATGSAA